MSPARPGSFVSEHGLQRRQQGLCIRPGLLVELPERGCEPGNGRKLSVAGEGGFGLPCPPEQVERALESLLDLVQPGWRAAVAHRRFLPTMTVMHAMATAQQGGTEERSGPQVEDVPGLYVVGDWVGAEGLLVDTSLASARRAAELIAAARTFEMCAAV